ncbi:MAG: shikimate dehydrogenase [Bacteroidales bacterium]|nr:shikimate dehydrogenase [Bacteroidales bacterium]
MKIYGLIGQTLRHSFSKRYFEQKFEQLGRFDCQYELFELPVIESLPDFIGAHPDLQGFNVTIPYKQSILPYLDDLEGEAQHIGAVNTVRIFRSEGQVHAIGYNTDAEGFRASLASKRLPTRALVLGTGGAAAAIAQVLRQWQVAFRMVSRTAGNGNLTYSELTPALIQQYPLIINCTPVGTQSDEKPALPYEAISEHHFLYDLVYNPEKTAFLKEGEKRHAHIQNGLQMLHLQAEAAWKIWQSNQRECL